MGWGKSWPTNEELKKFKEEWEGKFDPKDYQQNWSGIDLSKGDSQTVLTTWEDGKLKHQVIPPEELYITEAAPISYEAWANLQVNHKNLKPTHDPYANPNAFIYYECGCGAILDPQTKSFAALNNCASAKGWKIRFGENGYTPYCVKCGEGVE